MKKIKLGKYQHYRGKMYEVVGVARHSETLEDVVVYRALYNSRKFGRNALWIRPMKMFFEHVVVDGKKMPRFRFICKMPKKIAQK
jgi:hypothetical protein